MGTQQGFRADDEGFVLPVGLDADATYDILLNDWAVWSFTPGRDATGPRGRRVAWPKMLRRHLVGRADVALREYLTQEVVATAHHVFGGDDSVLLEVTDGAGRGLIVDKFGQLKKPMAEQAPEVRQEMLDASHGIIAALEDFGVTAFISYGTLLGAVRNGRIIGHDNDIDLAYASGYTHPVDIIRESFRIERALQRAGFRVRRGMGARLNVRLPVSDGTVRGIDVFTAAWVEDVLYIPSDTGFRLPRSVVEPARPIELEGESFPAPADPIPLLEATYGPSWEVPDPSFAYETPRWLFRRLAGWYGGLTMNRKTWDTFYTGGDRRRVPAEPTAFARWVQGSHPSDRTLIDLGTGTGRDALWFAAQGREVVGVDYSSSLGPARRQARRDDLPLRLEGVNLYDTRAILGWGAALARAERPVDLYARFLWHGLDRSGQENLLRLSSMALRRGGLLFLEFRTTEDRGRPKAFGRGRRGYADPQDVVDQIVAAGGQVVAREAGTGRANFDDEDPHVARIVASWNRGSVRSEVAS